MVRTILGVGDFDVQTEKMKAKKLNDKNPFEQKTKFIPVKVHK